MKYLKLFEEFENWDPFGEEKKPNPKNLTWRIIKYKPSSDYFIVQTDDNDFITLFRDRRYGELPEDSFDINPTINDETHIHVHDPNWKRIKYKDLPQEIKNKIIEK